MTAISDTAVPPLRQAVPHLRALLLRNTRITDATPEELEQYEYLVQPVVAGNAISLEHIEACQRMLQERRRPQKGEWKPSLQLRETSASN